MSEKDDAMALLEHRCEELKESMRQFTSLADKDENDETFEAVLRNEYELLREQFMEKNQSLSTEVEQLRDSLSRQKGDSLAYIERLKLQIVALSNKWKYFDSI